MKICPSSLTRKVNYPLSFPYPKLKKQAKLVWLPKSRKTLCISKCKIYLWIFRCVLGMGRSDPWAIIAFVPVGRSIDAKPHYWQGARAHPWNHSVPLGLRLWLVPNGGAEAQPSFPSTSLSSSAPLGDPGFFAGEWSVILGDPINKVPCHHSI